MPKGIKGFQKGHPRLNTGRTDFKKGHTPWNKGLEGFRPSPKTEFKIGHIPSHKGKKLGKEAVENIRKAHLESLNGKGQNHWNWKGGLTPLIRQVRGCSKYRQWRSDVFTRDDFTCVLCNQKGGWLEVDHHPKSFAEIFRRNNIRTIQQALDCKEFWNIDNGRTLCKRCHKKTQKKS